MPIEKMEMNTIIGISLIVTGVIMMYIYLCYLLHCPAYDEELQRIKKEEPYSPWLDPEDSRSAF